MAYEGDSIFWVEVEKVVPNPFQPRREFSEDKLSELAESIRMYGVLQPLVVTRKEIIGENGAFSTQYELIAGERRLRASKLAGLAQVPVIIRSEEENEQMKFELAIIENLQREDLNAVDRAMAFKQLAEQFNLSHAQVAKKMGRSREYVSNSIRLLQLPSTILNALKVADISDGHARTLLMLNDRPEEQDTLFREILLKKLSVREVERIARKIATDKVRKKDWGVDPEIIEIEKQFTETLGTRVQITKTDYGGKLTIDYFSQEDLEKLYKLVNHDDANIVVHQEQEDVGGTTISKIAAATPLAAVANDAVPAAPEFEIYRNGDDDPVIADVPDESIPVPQEMTAPASNFSAPSPASSPAPAPEVLVQKEESVPMYMAPEFDAYRTPAHTETVSETPVPQTTQSDATAAIPAVVAEYENIAPEAVETSEVVDTTPDLDVLSSESIVNGVQKAEHLPEQVPFVQDVSHDEPVTTAPSSGDAIPDTHSISSLEHKVENVHSEASHTTPIDTSDAATPTHDTQRASEDDDADLYSLKHFSL